MTGPLSDPALPGPGLLALGLGMVFLAGLLRGFTGFGFAIAAVPLLSLILPPSRVVPLVVLLQLAVAASGLRPALRRCDWPSVKPLALGALLATPPGIWALAVLPGALTRLVIAALVLAAVAVLAGGLRLAARPGGRGVLLFGLLAGLCNGLAGMPGPPVIAYYLAAPVAVDAARASMIVVFGATSLMSLGPLAVSGLLSPALLALAAAAAPGVWLGSWAGGRLYAVAPPGHYRPVALALLAAIAVLAGLRALGELAG